MPIKARKCFVPISPSRWVAKVYLTCDNNIAVEFQHGQHVKKILPHGPGAYLGTGGVPSVCCLYPGTQGDVAENLYDLAEVWTYIGEWVHAFLYKKFGYVLVAPPAGCGNCNTSCSITLNPASPTNGQAVTITVTVTNTDGSATKGAAPQGAVTIDVDGTQLCQQTLPSSNEASQNWQSISCNWTASCNPTNTHTIAATFTPADSDFASTNCSTAVVVSGCATTTCCPDGLPTTLHLTIAGSGGCGIDGTYPLTWTGSQWSGTLSNGCAIEFYCNSSTTPPSCGFGLVVYAGPAGDCTLCYEVSTCGSSSGTWESTSCSPPNWTSNPTNSIAATCACSGNGATFTITQ
ncbi:MAG TPA: hypothetical protein VMF69_08215 [Gemmataceae bacterium]|nr:hypothetical protein [Gemmataceae bacterium]